MDEHRQESTVDETDNEMIQVLRACGFHVRTSGLLDHQRPQVFGSLDSAIALFKLIVTGADAFPNEPARAARQSNASAPPLPPAPPPTRIIRDGSETSNSKADTQAWATANRKKGDAR